MVEAAENATHSIGRQSTLCTTSARAEVRRAPRSHWCQSYCQFERYHCLTSRRGSGRSLSLTTTDPSIATDGVRRNGRMSAPKLTRMTFRTSRLLQFCRRKELIAQTGHEHRPRGRSSS